MSEGPEEADPEMYHLKTMCLGKPSTNVTVKLFSNQLYNVHCSSADKFRWLEPGEGAGGGRESIPLRTNPESLKK